MTDAISTALSGVHAAARRLAGVADNVANQRSSGRLEPKPGEATAYQPVTTVQESTLGGGTRAYYRPLSPATRPVYEPDSPNADEAGLVAEPNVDAARELTEALSARQAYAANLKTIRAATDMQKELLKTFA